MLHNILKLYPTWTCVAWYTVLGITGILELMGLFRVHGAIPLTWLIRDSIPAWLRWTLMGWLMYHFGILTNAGQPTK